MQNIAKLLANNTNKQRNITPWLMWIFAVAFYAYQFILSVFPGVAAKDLMLSFHANATDLGHLAAFYLYAYTAMQIPVGLLLDRYGPRRLVTAAAAVAALGCLIFATSNMFAFATVGQLLIGLGVSFAAVSALYVAATWLPQERYAFATGIIVTIGMLGAFGGESPVAILVGKIGWRQTLLIFAAIGSILAICLWKFIRDKKKLPLLTPSISKKTQKFWHGLHIIIQDRQSWLIAAYGCLMFMPTIVFGSLWGVPFIRQRLAIDNTHAAFIVSMLFLGWAIGAPIFGWLSDKLQSRKKIMLLGSIFTTITLLLVLLLPSICSTGIAILLLLFGFFSSGFLPAFSVIRELNPKDHTGAATGFMNTLNMLGGAIGQPLIGFLLDLTWDGAKQGGIHFYTLHDFRWALMILPLAMFTAGILLIWIRETYPQKN